MCDAVAPDNNGLCPSIKTLITTGLSSVSVVVHGCPVLKDAPSNAIVAMCFPLVNVNR